MKSDFVRCGTPEDFLRHCQVVVCDVGVIRFQIIFSSKRCFISIQVKVTIPDEVLNNESGDATRRVLEEFALAGYQSGQLIAAQVRRLLGFSSRYEVDGFLKAHGVYLDYNIEDFEQDLISNRELLICI